MKQLSENITPTAPCSRSHQSFHKMNNTTAAKTTLLLLMLCSGALHFTSASQRLRFLDIKKTEVDATLAINECKKTGASLFTLYDAMDAQVAADIADSSFSNFTSHKYTWLGLKKSLIANWSNGDPVRFNKRVELLHDKQRCEAMSNNTWKSFNCSEKKFFMCSKGSDYRLVNTTKTWCQALQHCRHSGSDLVSIHNDEENQEVIDHGKNKDFWIGLMRDNWQWQDNGCSTFRRWNMTNDPAPDNDCTRTEGNEGNIYRYNCDNGAPLICAAGSVRIKVIANKKTWEQAYDHCEERHSRLLTVEDEHDKKALEQWLNYTRADGPFWIGLRQSRVFGFWIWTSGRTVDNPNWKNNTLPELTMTNKCGVIHKDDKKWSDHDCLEQRPFLCEEDIVRIFP